MASQSCQSEVSSKKPEARKFDKDGDLIGWVGSDIPGIRLYRWRDLFPRSRNMFDDPSPLFENVVRAYEDD